MYVYCPSKVEGVKGPCYGKKNCESGRQKDGSTELCRCFSHEKYFDECDDPCNTESVGYCTASSSLVKSMIYVKDKCTTSKGTVIKLYIPCNGKGNCEGTGESPCYGKVECTSGTIPVDPCTCGGLTYGSSCVIKCPYEQTAADCKAGQTFTQRSKDNSGNWFGECK